MIISIVKNQVSEQSIRFSLTADGKEIGRAWLNITLEDGKNDGELKYTGMIGDVFVLKEYQSKGLGAEIIREVIEVAREKKCTKLIPLSRFENVRAHAFYERLGFKKHGFEFRLDL